MANNIDNNKPVAICDQSKQPLPYQSQEREGAHRGGDTQGIEERGQV